MEFGLFGLFPMRGLPDDTCSDGNDWVDRTAAACSRPCSGGNVVSATSWSFMLLLPQLEQPTTVSRPRLHRSGNTNRCSSFCRGRRGWTLGCLYTVGHAGDLPPPAFFLLSGGKADDKNKKWVPFLPGCQRNWRGGCFLARGGREGKACCPSHSHLWQEESHSSCAAPPASMLRRAAQREMMTALDPSTAALPDLPSN